MAAAPQSSNQQDNSMGILWTIAAILFGLGVVWVTFKSQITGFYLHIKLWEINHILRHFTHRLDDVATAISVMLSSPPDSVHFGDVVNIGTVVGQYVRYFIIPPILLLAAWIYLSSSTRVFKHAYSMRELVHLEKTNWPQIVPVAGLDLVKTNIDRGPWAMALTPMQFCKRHDLLVEHRPGRREGAPRSQWNRVEVSLKRGKASQVFAVQLGPVWPGAMGCPPHVRALFAAFAARINGDTASAIQLYRQMSATSATRLDFTGADELLKKHVDSPIVKQIIESHAYVLTVMAEMLVGARNDGVQATADFLWLKPVDRKLWYMLNTVGRQTPFAEVAGPFAHWKAEREASHRLLLPMVEEATRALELALKDLIYRPDARE